MFGRTNLTCIKRDNSYKTQESHVPFYYIAINAIEKLQEKCKNNRENKISLYSTKSIRASLNNNKNKSTPTTRKSHVPFYMITNARILNFNFWIPVMLNSNISLGDLAVYNWCSRTFWTSIIYEHFTPPCEHIYCRLPYGLNLNQFSLFEYDCCQVIQ